jgi:hypothetical protein
MKMSHLLFAVTADKKLLARDPKDEDNPEWKRIDSTPCPFNGLMSVGGVLFGAGTDDKVYARFAKLTDPTKPLEWSHVGAVINVITMAASSTADLFCINNNDLWVRPPLLHGVDWTIIDKAESPRALTCGIDKSTRQEKLILARANGELRWRTTETKKAPWEGKGYSADAHALAALDGVLYANSSAKKLLSWDIDFKAKDLKWKEISGSVSMNAMTAAEVIPSSVKLADLPALEDTDTELRTGTNG